MNSEDGREWVATRLRVIFQREADLVMARVDVSTGLAEFHARLLRDRRHRAIRALVACLVLLIGIAAAVGLARAVHHPQPVRPPTIDPGGPRLNDPSAVPLLPGGEFTGSGRRYLAPGFGPEFSVEEPPAPWALLAPYDTENASRTMGRPERGAVYLVRGDRTHSTQLLTFLIWRNVLDDNLRQTRAPSALAAWLATNPHLANVTAQPAIVSGMNAMQVDAKVASVPAHDRPQNYCGRPLTFTRCLLLADNAEERGAVPDGFYRGRIGPRAAVVGKDQLVRFWIVRLSNGEQLVIHASAPPEQFDRFISEADQIVKSLVIAT